MKIQWLSWCGYTWGALGDTNTGKTWCNTRNTWCACIDVVLRRRRAGTQETKASFLTDIEATHASDATAIHLANRTPRHTLLALNWIWKVGCGAEVKDAGLVGDIRNKSSCVDNVAVTALQALHIGIASSAVSRTLSTGAWWSGVELRTVEETAARIV